jgi:hypothetical protein
MNEDPNLSKKTRNKLGLKLQIPKNEEEKPTTAP